MTPSWITATGLERMSVRVLDDMISEIPTKLLPRAVTKNKAERIEHIRAARELHWSRPKGSIAASAHHPNMITASEVNFWLRNLPDMEPQ